MYGITARVARAHGYLGPMKALPLQLATEIARKEYWDKLRLDEIYALSPALAMRLFDTNINMWSGAAGLFFQRSLNLLNRRAKDFPDLKPDGLIGDKTIAALRAYLKLRGKRGEAVLVASIQGMRTSDYARQTEANEAKEDFYFGWLWMRICEERLLEDEPASSLRSASQSAVTNQ